MGELVACDLGVKDKPTALFFQDQNKSFHASPPNGTFTSLQSRIRSRSTGRWVQRVRLTVNDVNLDFVFHRYISTFQLQLMELCAVLVTCLNAPFHFLDFWWLPAIPPGVPRACFSTRLWSLLTYPPEDYSFQLLSVTFPDAGSGSKDWFHLLPSVCLRLTCHIHLHVMLQVSACLCG